MGSAKERGMVNSSYMRLAVCGGLLALSACSTDGLTRTFGLTRDAPDEFTVTTRAPLSVGAVGSVLGEISRA